jgi:O-glycosyl hydrolase
MDKLTLIPDLKQEKQSFHAWGTSLCWWANVIGNWQDEQSVERICTLLFSESDGLGINCVRYNLGAGENPPNINFFRKGADIPCIMQSDGSYDVFSDYGQLNILKKAVSKGVSFIETFSNSPPQWMTKSGSTAGSVDGLCNLDEEKYDEFANFLVTCSQKISHEIKKSIDSIAPINEPLSFWWKADNNQEGCHFDVLQQSKLIERVYHHLSERNLDISISAPECWSTYETIYACNHFPASSMERIGQINTHSYYSDAQSRKELRNLAKKFNKPLWMSEVTCGGNNSHSHNDMNSALELCKNITLHLNEMEAVGWVYWQAVENELLQHNHGLIHANFEGSEDYYITKQYYAFAHYSKYIRPGYIILNTENENVLLAKSPDSKKLVIVIYNPNQDKDLALNLVLPPKHTFVKKQIFQTTSNYDHINLQKSNSNIIMLPGESITTLIFESLQP